MRQKNAMNDADTLASSDDLARANALDVTRSWLVQAPAGSGKTSLLIQRFLALLATVDRPERIVATTFTRKAAAEMRARILEALQQAAMHGPGAALRAHEAVTRELARAALARDHALGWRLLEQPARLRIVTIDALAASIARQAPLSSGVGALPMFVDDARWLHRDAARAALASAAGDDPNWRTFLQWQDNDADAATRLVAQMLAARDRWPRRMLDADAVALRRDVEAALVHEARAAVHRVHEHLRGPLGEALPRLARYALDFHRAEGSAPPYCTALERVYREEALPGLDVREAWHALGDWLLTREGAFRRSVTKSHGFPPAGRGAEAEERERRKAEFTEWLVAAAGVPGLADAWQRVRELPPPRFGDAAWAFAVAAMRILPQAVDALEHVFRSQGKADFTEATLRALRALDDAGNPSELLFAIDYRLSHLLVDEFQDTSSAQLALLNRLTEGFVPGDGRTLFAVGDPMQSIYRFRHAEVRLFLEAQRDECVGDVPVGVLELARNFRSQASIVRWVNDVFAAVLPARSDAAAGEAAYRLAHPDTTKPLDLAPTIELAPSREAEADAVLRRIVEARAAGLATIAVLVRARAHAEALLPALRRANIAYSAVDLEGLQDRLVTRDLLSLARALAQPADRFAWLAVLRAPWCGLTLADLLAVADATRGEAIVEALQKGEVRAALSADGGARIDRVLRAIAPALRARGEMTFAMRLRSAWIALGGPACADAELDRDGAERVFRLVAEHEQGGDLADFDTMLETASELFAEAGDADPGTVQVMTLHKAKGLEFDAVILPGLDLASGRSDTPLLRWKVREHAHRRIPILAPLRARMGAQAETDPVYQWLGTLDAAEEAAELGRLLYVGATRARRRLHLTAVANVEPNGKSTGGWKRPRSGTALGRLWDALAAHLPIPMGDASDGTVPRTGEGAAMANASGSTAKASAGGDAARTGANGSGERAPLLVRLPAGWRLPELPASLPVAAPVVAALEALPFDWADATSAAIGTVAHRLLAQVASDGLAAWTPERARAESGRIVAELAAEGVDVDLRDAAAARVVEVVVRTLQDPRGRWLFDPAHGDARTEWALAGVDDGRIVHVVLDRSFVAAGVRYIVDFKTGSHQGGDRATFLARERERYAPQLARYARIVRALDDRYPVRIALYHPLVEDGWQEEAAPDA